VTVSVKGKILLIFKIYNFSSEPAEPKSEFHLFKEEDIENLIPVATLQRPTIPPVRNKIWKRRAYRRKQLSIPGNFLLYFSYIAQKWASVFH